MATLFQRSNGVYYFIYQWNGKRRWKSTGETRKALALEFLKKFDHTAPPPPKGILLSKFIREFLATSTTSLSPGTVKIYSSTLRSFMSVTGDRQLDAITARHID